MAPMPIHTAPVDKIEYVRIIGSDRLSYRYRKSCIGAVGIATGYVIKQNLIFVTVLGNNCVFNIEDIEYITKKEYFVGALGG